MGLNKILTLFYFLQVLRHIPIEVKQQIEDTIQEDPTYCEICGECDREDRMLLCDGCDLGYHMECLQPQLFHIPLDEWYCSECSQNMQNDAEAVSVHILLFCSSRLSFRKVREDNKCIDNFSQREILNNCTASNF